MTAVPLPQGTARGGQRWAGTHFHLPHDLESGDLMAFVYLPRISPSDYDTVPATLEGNLPDAHEVWLKLQIQPHYRGARSARLAICRDREAPPHRPVSGYVAADLGCLCRFEPGCVADPVLGTAFISADVPRIRPRPSCFAIVERRSE
jgi:hypothetical protein